MCYRWACLWIALLVLHAAPAAHCQVVRAYIPPQQAGGQSRVQMLPASGSVAVRYAAIVGNVAKPGVVPLTRTARLAEAVEAAGGLTAGSTGQFRIIRGGRGNLKVWYSPKSTFTLLPDDIALAEGASHAQGAGRVLQGRNNVRLSELSNVAPARVSLALLRFIDRPVVIDLPTDQANLQGLMAHLRHSARGSFTLVGATGVLEHVTMEKNALTPLKPGTVVIADPGQIDRSALPALPPVLGAAARVDAPVPQNDAAVGADSRQTSLPRVTAFLPSSPQPAIRATAAPGDEPRIEDVQAPDVPQMNAPVFPTAPSVLVPPPLDTPPAPTAPVSPAIPETFPAADVTAETSAAAKLGFDKVPTPKVSVKAKDSRKTASPPYLFILMATCSVFGLTLFVLTELERRKTPVAESVPPLSVLPPQTTPVAAPRETSEKKLTPPAETHLRYCLDALIKNKLEFLEEPVVVPTDLKFSARPADPVQHRVDAVDAEVAKPEPHFTADVVTDPAVADRRAPRADRSKTADVLNRALNSVSGNRS